MIIRWNHWPIPKGMDDFTLWWITWIRTNAPENVLRHALKHQAQASADWLMPIKYVLSKSARYEYEVEAYKVSIANGLPIKSAVWYIQNGYNLGYTREEIRAELVRDGD